MKRYKTYKFDGYETHTIIWQVWSYDGKRMLYKHAEFYGLYARECAREHAKRLNKLAEKLKP